MVDKTVTIKLFLLLLIFEFVFRPKEQKPLYSFSTVTKIPSNVKVGQADYNLPGSAARQHYLGQSRYLPGKTNGQPSLCLIGAQFIKKNVKYEISIFVTYTVLYPYIYQSIQPPIT